MLFTSQGAQSATFCRAFDARANVTLHATEYGGATRNAAQAAAVGRKMAMARKPADISKLDDQAYANAGEALRLATAHLPENLVADLAREVVRRLSFRMPGVDARQGYPSSQEINRFCEALLSEDEEAASRIISRLQREGLPVETIYLGYIAGASRRLGEMWETDEASFIEVSLGTGRLYRIMRGLRHAIAPMILRGRTRSPAMFVLVPGESHTLGIEMAVDLFRRDGGVADVCIGKSHDDVLALAETRYHGVIVLVANSDRSLPNLIQLAVALRISQPLTPIALAGNLVDTMPEVKTMVEAELVMSDIKSAIPDLRRFTEDP